MSLFRTKKSTKRINELNKIMLALKSPDIYGVINYERQKEDMIKQYLHQPLLSAVKDILIDRGIVVKNALNRAKECLLWESNRTQTIKNLKMFGVGHRPDFVVKFNDMSIAVEIKRGNNGSGIREGIGQSIVYSQMFDFVVYLYIDTSKNKVILNSMNNDIEDLVVRNLWVNSNIMFDVV